jgi:uncharacterized cupin superfamily protein
MEGIAHWDEVEPLSLRRGPMQLDRVDLGEAAGTKTVGVARLKLDPGGRSSPVHVELDEEEIFFVLTGSGLLWQDGKTHEVRAGDTIVHRVAWETHTLVAGADGLDVLAFGERTNATASYLPRAGVVRMGVTVEVTPEPHPWDREAAAGELELPEPSPRPSNIVNLDDVEGEYDGRAKTLARVAGAERTGLNWVSLRAGEDGAPPHCHSEEEEIFVVLDGSGSLLLSPSPQAHRVDGAAKVEERPIRAGHVISRPPATRIAHSFVAGDGGLTYLAYGTRRPNDICYYPRSNKIFFRGVGLIARLENLDYMDGEPG